MIFGEEVIIEDSDAMDLSTAAHVGLFEMADGTVVGMCHCDIGAAASLSCALSLIPPDIASEMVKEKSISDMAVLNLKEVMNMFSSLYMDDNTDHLRFTKLKDSASKPATDFSQRLDFELPNTKYPGGRVSFEVV